MIVALIAAVAMSAARSPIAPADRPSFVTTTIDAVRANRAKPISQEFVEIVEVGESASSPIAAQDALALLTGCSQADVHLLFGNTYTVDYQCPTRRAVAKGCDSGDLFLILDRSGSRNSLAVAHRRKLTKECPPPAPPAPPGFRANSGKAIDLQKGYEDPRDYYRRAKLMLDSALAGNDHVIFSFVWSSSEIYLYSTVASEKRNVPLNGPNLREYFGGCQREGQIEVDQRGAEMLFACANKQLTGRYLVSFEYRGQKVLLVFISKQKGESGNSATKVGENG